MKRVDDFLSRKLPEQYGHRTDSIGSWAERFGPAETERIGRFLRLYCGAFLFRESDAVRLHPDDKPIDIYRQFHAHRPVDQMEFETFHLRLKRQFRIEFSSADFECLTLGEMYERIQQAEQTGSSLPPPVSWFSSACRRGSRQWSASGGSSSGTLGRYARMMKSWLSCQISSARAAHPDSLSCADGAA